MNWKFGKALSLFAQLRNSFIAVIILIQVLLITLSILFGKMTVRVLDENQHESIKKVIQNVNNSINSGTDGSRVALSCISKNRSILESFAKRDREKLLSLSAPVLTDLKTMGFKQFQFHIPTGTSFSTFLRVHQPDKFGEDLTYRPMIFKANASNEMIYGLEQGKSGYGFRTVAPVSFEGKHIGSVEFGYDFGEPFLAELNKNFPGRWAIYNLSRGTQAVDDRILMATLGKDRDGDFKNLPLSEQVMTQITKGEPFFELSRETDTGTLFMPVRNYRGDIVLVLKYVFATEYFKSIQSVTYTAAIICLIGLVLSALVLFILNELISGPVRKLVLETEKIRNFQLDDEISFTSSFKEINELIESTKSMKAGLQSFKKYVPAQLVRQLIETKQEAKVGGQRRHITAFFTDVADFTRISESLTPNELTQQLSEYFSVMSDVIIKHQGTVDKYIGDCIMAFWGAPLDIKNHAELACKAALECQLKSAELNEKWKKEGKSPFNTRIGINSGEIVVGNIGSSQRLSYTIIGDEVNLASRLESLNKTYGTMTLVSENTVQLLPQDFALRILDFVVVSGKTKPCTIYELVAEKGDIKRVDLEYLSAFNEAIGFYKERHWDRALEVIEDLLLQKPSDRAAMMLRERSLAFKHTPPPVKWRGENVYTEK